MNNKEKKYIILFIFLFLGVVSTVQFKSILNSTKNKPSVAYEIESLVKELEAEKATGVDLKENIDFALKKKESIFKNFSDYNDEGQLTAQWEEAKLYAGLTDVKGDGIIITLNDAVEKNPIGADLTLLHDDDINRVVNELKRGGAQAISINDERVISSTEITCAGPTIRVNRNRYAVPFVIKAIGDSKRMISTFEESEIYAILNWLDLRVDVKEAKGIEIPKFNGNIGNLLNGLEVVDQ